MLAERSTLLAVPARQIIIQEGDPGDSLYLLQSGKLEVILKDQAGQEIIVATLQPGDNVGEMALLTGAIRSATVRTLEPSILWQLTRYAFEQVANARPQLRPTMERSIVGGLHRAKLRAALYENQLFKTLDVALLPDLEQELDLVALQGGDTLMRQGDRSDALYIVLTGRLRIVSLTSEGVETKLNELGSGQTVGEMGLITGEPRSATIYAIRNTLLGRLDSAAFYRLLQKHPQSMTRLFSSRIITDIRDKTRESQRKQTTSGTIALIAVGTDVPLAQFAEQLTQALRTYGSTLYISDTLVDHRLGQPGIAHAPLASTADIRLSLWFSEQEAKHDYLIYASNQDATQSAADLTWTERCMQHADHILYVAWADSPPHVVAIGKAVKTERSLVLLHPADRRIPVGTQRWLDALRPHWHHHMKWGVGDDISRLARLVTGRGIGLVLGGGGARGFAHIGVIRALQEAHIPIDLIGGTSMGAFIGGLLSMGHDADSIERQLVTHMGKRKQLTDLTVPFTSVISGKKFEMVMRRLYGDTEIVDTWRNFFCVTSDITRAVEVVHRNGAMWKYLRASGSLPVVFPPQVDGANLLVDGCFMNNLPISVMHNTVGCGTIIGVDVTLEIDMRDKNQFGDSLSGWDILKSKFNPFAEPVNAPGLVQILFRLAELKVVERGEEDRRLTDLYIQPPIHMYGAQALEQHAEIIEVGYRAAQPLIANWVASRKGTAKLGYDANGQHHTRD